MAESKSCEFTKEAWGVGIRRVNVGPPAFPAANVMSGVRRFPSFLTGFLLGVSGGSFDVDRCLLVDSLIFLVR